jgi:hypothetical protein
MLFWLLVLSIASVNTVHALPIYLRPSMRRRSANSDIKSVKDHMSTEAVIGIIGVVVAIIGIASSLAWSRARGRSRGRSSRAPCLSNTEGMLSCYHALDTSRKLTRNFARRSTIIESPFARLPFRLVTTDSSLDAPRGRRRSITTAPAVLLCAVRADNGTWGGSITGICSRVASRFQRFLRYAIGRVDPFYLSVLASAYYNLVVTVQLLSLTSSTILLPSRTRNPGNSTARKIAEMA